MLIILGMAIGLLVGIPLGRRLDRRLGLSRRLDDRADDAERAARDMHRLHEVTGEVLRENHDRKSARMARLGQTLPRPPATTLDPFGPRRKS